MSGNVMNNWKGRYYAEVQQSVKRYESMNAHAETIVRKITPEEQKEYELAEKRRNSNFHKLKVV